METLNVAVTLLMDRRLTSLYLNIKHKQYVLMISLLTLTQNVLYPFNIL